MSNKQLYNVAKIELRYTSAVRPSQRPICASSEASYNLLMKNWELERLELQEEFKVLYLDRQCRCLGIYDASMGGTTGTVADLKLIFSAALLCRAESIVLAHNHPSGVLRPSAADIKLTNQFATAGKMLTLRVMDHLIVTRFNGYYSFADHGLIDHS